MQIVIDGYNLIRQVPALMRHENLSLESGRDALVDKLSSYKKIKGHHIRIVFDGVLNMSDWGSEYSEKGIRIIFSSEGSSADEIIKKIVTKEGARVTVVTSDRAIIAQAQKYGASVISSPDFYERMIMAEKMGAVDVKDKDEDNAFVHKRWMTKKKGPSKRLPKKERKNQIRLKKL